MATTQKIWAGEIIHLYPKQWIVFVEVECDPEISKYMRLEKLIKGFKQSLITGERSNLKWYKYKRIRGIFNQMGD